MNAIGAVLIEGPKACGKTATASRLASTVVRFDQDLAARAMVELDPGELFAGEPPILFDEWQLVPSIWDRVRREVDDRGLRGQFILTGSATPRDTARRHSGAGRVGRIKMRPMSLFESGHSTGSVSLAALLRGEAQRGPATDLHFQDLLERIVIGGWPDLLGADEHTASQWIDDYLGQIVEVDVPEMGHRRNPRGLTRLLSSLARGVGQAVKAKELATDVGGTSGPIAPLTLDGYLDSLARLGITENSEAWRPHMRSSTRLRSAEVRYFVDPSLGPAALGIGTAALRADPRAAGFHFEALAIRDLRIYAEPLQGTIDSWRDANGHEVDAVLSLRDGTWAAFEIKMNPTAVDAAAASLLRFAAKVDAEKHGEATALCVITGSGHAGLRADGVHVVPITALGP
ncbi:MAG: ATP-binding protein [Actinobacteria bacterium]|nr:ATP-binding protein [Actinomycetota bacterium]